MDLTAYLQGHNAVAFLGEPTAILQWLLGTPNPIDIAQQSILALSLDDLGAIFAERDVPVWFSSVCSKISNNTHYSPPFLSVNEIRLLPYSFLEQVLLMGALTYDMQGLLYYFIANNPEKLGLFVLLLLIDGKISLLSFQRLQVEMSPLPRWQSIGLVVEPTLADVLGALS